MNRLEAQRIVLAKVNECIALARSLYPTYTNPDPSIGFDLRGRSCGGTALGSRALQFNLDWYAADPVRFLNIVVPHEVAHIVDDALNPHTPRVTYSRGRIRRERRVSHGRTWVRICLALGGDGQRTCNIAAESGTAPQRARRVQEYRYTSVLGREVWLGPVHHRKLQEKGDMRHPVNGRPLYSLNSRTAGSIHKAGFTGESRMRA